MNEIWKVMALQAVQWLPRAGLGLLIFVAFWMGGALVQGMFTRIRPRIRSHAEVWKLLGQTLRLALITFGAVTALGTAGVQVSALVAGLGLTGFALGFALKDIISNLLSGVLILIFRPFKHGDKISIAGLEGAVTDIDLRYTTLETETRKYLIPNATLFSNPITILREATPTQSRIVEEKAELKDTQKIAQK